MSRAATIDRGLPADDPRWLHALSTYRDWMAAPAVGKPRGARLYVACLVAAALDAQREQLPINAGQLRERAASAAGRVRTGTPAGPIVAAPRRRPSRRPDPFAGAAVRGARL